MGAFDFQKQLAAAGLGYSPDAPQPSQEDPMQAFRDKMAGAGLGTVPGMNRTQTELDDAPRNSGPIAYPFGDFQKALVQPSAPVGAPLDQVITNTGGNLPQPGVPTAPHVGALPGGIPWRQEAGGGPPLTTPKPAARMGGGGGGDFGMAKTARDLQGARQEVITGLQREKTDQEKLTEEQVVKTSNVTQLQDAEAKRQADMAADHQVASNTYQQTMADFSRQSQDFSDQLRQQKVDPKRLFGSMPAATKFAFAVSSALDGYLSAVQKRGGNDTIDMLDKMVDRDVAAQNANYDRQKDYLNQRNTTYGQMRQAYGDKTLADNAYRQAMLESAKMQVDSQTAKFGIPEMAQRGKLLSDQLQQGIDKQVVSNAEMAHQAAVQRANAAASAAQAARAHEEKMAQQLFENTDKVAARQQEQQKIDQEQQKIDQAREKGSPGDEKAKDRAREAASQLRIFNGADPKALSSGTRVGAFVGEHLPSFSDDARSAMNKRDAYNTKLLVGAGAAYRWGSGGMEPKNEDVIERMIHPYKILPSDNEKIAKEKIEAFKEYIQQESDSPTPRFDFKPDPAKK